jgi:lipopolysaccharide exporter
MTDTPPPLAQVLVRNTVWTSLGSYANILLGFGSNLVLTRLLPAEVFGYFAMGNFWTSQLGLRSKAGLSYAAIQQSTLDAELLGTYQAVDLTLATASLVLSGVAAAVLARLGYPPAVLLCVVALMAAECLPALTGALSMALEKELQVSRLTLLSLLLSVVAYAVAIGLALTGAGVVSLLAINGVTAVLGLGGMYLLIRQRLPDVLRWQWRFNRALAVDLLRRGLPTGLSLTLMLGFVTTYDNFLVGTFAGYDTLGFYDRAYRTAQWPNVLLSTIVGRIGFLTFARVKDDPARLLHAVRLALWVLLTLGVPMGLFLAFGARDVISVLYGERWLASAAYLPYIAVYALSGPFWSVGFWLAVARKDTRMSVVLTLSQAVLLLVVATPLTWRFGVTGTLVGVGVTMALALMLSASYVFRTVALNPLTTLGPTVLAVAAAAACMFALNAWPAWQALPSLAHLVGVGLVGPGVFLIAVIALRPGEFWERVSYVRQAWRRA